MTRVSPDALHAGCYSDFFLCFRRTNTPRGTGHRYQSESLRQLLATLSDTRVTSPAYNPNAPVSAAHQWCKSNATQGADPRTEQRNLSTKRVLWLRCLLALSSCLLAFVLALDRLLSRPVPVFCAADPVGASAVLGERFVLSGIPWCFVVRDGVRVAFCAWVFHAAVHHRLHVGICSMKSSICS